MTKYFCAINLRGEGEGRGYASLRVLIATATLSRSGADTRSSGNPFHRDSGPANDEILLTNEIGTCHSIRSVFTCGMHETWILRRREIYVPSRILPCGMLRWNDRCDVRVRLFAGANELECNAAECDNNNNNLTTYRGVSPGYTERNLCISNGHARDRSGGPDESRRITLLVDDSGEAFKLGLLQPCNHRKLSSDFPKIITRHKREYPTDLPTCRGVSCN